MLHNHIFITCLNSVALQYDLLLHTRMSGHPYSEKLLSCDLSPLWLLSCRLINQGSHLKLLQERLLLASGDENYGSK